MTAPTSSNPLKHSPGPVVRLSHPVVSGTNTYAGQFAAMALAAASAGDGLLVAYTAAQGQCLLGGQFSDEVVGDGTLENNFDGSGGVLKRVAVTGVVDNATDLGKCVWAADSGPPLVLTDPGTTAPFGVIVNVTGAAEADVWQFGMEAQFLLGLLGQSTFSGTSPNIAVATYGDNVGIA